MEILMTSVPEKYRFFHLLSVKQCRIYLVIHTVHVVQCFERIYSIHKTKCCLRATSNISLHLYNTRWIAFGCSKRNITNLLPTQIWYASIMLKKCAYSLCGPLHHLFVSSLALLTYHSIRLVYPCDLSCTQIRKQISVTIIVPWSLHSNISKILAI